MSRQIGGGPSEINRREAVQRIAMMLGASLVGAELFISGTKLYSKAIEPGFSPEDRQLLDEIAETILPKTDTPGAKELAIGDFMAFMVTDCYDEKHHGEFVQGLQRVSALAASLGSKPFVDCTPAVKVAVLEKLRNESQAVPATGRRREIEHPFQMFQQLTLLGYFTSKKVGTEVIRYVEVPGSFIADMPYKKGDPVWY